jgi:hypothetical protein
LWSKYVTTAVKSSEDVKHILFWFQPNRIWFMKLVD